ncbi:MAG: hypothetical protein AAGI71_12275 [Bacteroidota bacterium]
MTRLISILVGGLVASIVFTAVVFISCFWCPEVWISELTEGRETGGASPWKGALIAAGLFLAMARGAGVTAWCFGAGSTEPCWAYVVVAWGVIVVINLWDLFFIDIYLYMVVKPSFMQWEGYPPLYRYWPHVKGCLVGVFPMGLPMAAFAAWVGFIV